MSAQGATMRGVLLGALVASQLLGQRPDLDDEPYPCWAIEVRAQPVAEVSLLGRLQPPLWLLEIPALTGSWLPCDLVAHTHNGGRA